ncbi:efflux RND transporter permease subunit [Pontibacter sp. G13]|uniref:efflux RND transporter permease subunit n=1 Tax=Pontibacter sp. G13 TaxID=3074898 RepID=UPI002889951D|nr:efflux RND transporter permease subunit [Pontibacter sp. G13]WNJ16201.1 efflux RND transporter permease subunit [Pontibacter sp. G13]
MKNIISYFIKYSFSGDLMVLLILIFGFFGLNGMRSTFFPETESKLIQVQIVYPGASPEEIEEGIVAKIEDNLKGLTGVDRVTSVSSENAGSVTVEITKGNDIDVILADVKNAVDQIPSFPVGMEPPVVFKQEPMTVALNFAIYGDLDLRTLKQYAREIENDLLAMDGLSKVELTGFPEEEIEIAVHENDLRKYGFTFDQIVNAVKGFNIEVTGGTIKTPTEELLIRSKNKGYYADDLLDIVVATAPDGREVLLREVATVRDRWEDTPNRTFVNGRPAVGINVSNTIDENLLDISTMTREYIEEFNEDHDAVQAVIINDGSVVLNERIDLLTENGIIGFVLVLILLAMFLQVRLAFWVAIAIPVSLMGMFILAPMIGVSINVITLFGMILVIGILVDDGIVISENIYQHFEMGKEPLQAAIDGTMEVLPAVLSAILTTMVAFGSFLFLDGISGDFFAEMSIVVILTLFFSLVEGAFILPGHVAHSKALSRDKKEEGAVKKFFEPLQNALWNFMDWMKEKLYAPVLRFFIDNVALGLAIPIGILILSFAMIGSGNVKTTFFPYVENDFITATLKMPAGTSEDITQKWLDHIEKAVWEINEEYKADRTDGKDIVLIVSKNLGPTTYQGTVLVNLLRGEERGVSSALITDKIREAAGTIYGSESVIYGVASPFGKPVSVALRGSNLVDLGKAAEELKGEMIAVTELKDITDNNQEGLREIDVKLKPKAYLLGLTPQFVVAQVRSGFFGAEVQRLQRGKDEVRVWVRFDEIDRNSIGKLEQMRIRTATGESFPLKEVAELSVERGIIAINRLEGEREIRVQADLASPSTSGTDMIALIESDLLPPILAKYPSVRYSFEGQVRENTKTQKSSGTVMPIALLLMVSIIALTFRSVAQTLSVLIIIPFGMIGVIWGHFAFGKAISILSGLGIFALIGIMVNDALVLVSAHNTLIKRGMKFKEALYEASVSRFRPIFLTSITTIAGLAPLVFEKSFQAQFLIPMAISVACGLAAATLIILLMLPSLLVFFNSLKLFIIGGWEGERPTPTEIEPAFEGRKNYIGLYIVFFVIVGALVASFFIYKDLLGF